MLAMVLYMEDFWRILQKFSRKQYYVTCPFLQLTISRNSFPLFHYLQHDFNDFIIVVSDKGMSSFCY